MNTRYLINYQKGGKPFDLVFYDIFKDMLDDNNSVKFSNMFAIDYVNSFENGLEEDIEEDILIKKFKLLLDKYKIKMNPTQINQIINKKIDDLKLVKRELESRKLSKNMELNRFKKNNIINFEHQDTSDLIKLNLKNYSESYSKLYYQIQIDKEIIKELTSQFKKEINNKNFPYYFKYFNNNSKFSSRVKNDIDICIKYVVDMNYYKKFIYSIQKQNEGYLIINEYDKMTLSTLEFNKMLTDNKFFNMKDNNLSAFINFISVNYKNILEYFSTIKTNLFDKLFELNTSTPTKIYDEFKLTDIKFKYNQSIDDIMNSFEGNIKNLDKGENYRFFNFNNKSLENNITNATIFFNHKFKKINDFFNKNKLIKLTIKDDVYFNQNMDKLNEIENYKKYYYIRDDIFSFEDQEVALSKAILANMKDKKFFEIFYQKYNILGKEYSFDSIKSDINNDISNDGSIYENNVLDDAYKRMIGLLNNSFKNIVQKLISKYMAEREFEKVNKLKNKLKDNIYQSNNLRILNGYSFSETDDMVIGELDVMIIDNDNNLLAVGEIKSYIDGIFKAYNQLIRFGKFINDKKHINIFKDDQTIRININGDFKEKLKLYMLQPELNKYFFIILKNLKFSNVPEGNQKIYCTISKLMKEDKISYNGTDFKTNLDDEISKKIIKEFDKFRDEEFVKNKVDTISLLNKYKLSESSYRNNLIIYN